MPVFYIIKQNMVYATVTDTLEFVNFMPKSLSDILGGVV